MEEESQEEQEKQPLCWRRSKPKLELQMGRLYGSFLHRILLEINSLKICNYYIST